MDMRENADSYIVVVDMPRVNASDVTVTLSGQLLIVTVRHAGMDQESSVTREMKRVFRFPGPVVNDGTAMAQFSNHVLRTVVPKASAAIPPSSCDIQIL
jgi:HSP20 family molecular chaperone IbpA